MNTANKLTMLRVALIPVFLILLYLRFPFHMYFALTVFILASVTDFVDGYIARHYNQVTDFGKFMDPLADKVLVMAALLWFVEAAACPAWVLLDVIVREFRRHCPAAHAVSRGRVSPPPGRAMSTASTMVCICLMLLIARPALDLVCAAVILVTTVYSGASIL